MITINPDRLLADLQALRQIGAHESGVVRMALMPKDLGARRWLANPFVKAGLTPVFDPVGNLFGLPGRVRKGKTVLIGSDSDTQPEAAGSMAPMG